MNATPPVFHVQQPVSDAAPPDAPAGAPAAAGASGTSATGRTGSQDFAAALSDAGGKPARKGAANKQQDRSASGSSLPAAGNQPPPVIAPAPATTSVPAPAAATNVAAAKLAPSDAQGSQPGAIGAAATAPANADGTTGILTLPNLDPAPEGCAALPGAPVSPDSAVGANAATPSSAGPTATGSGMNMPHATPMRTLAAPGPSTPAGAAQLPTGNARLAASSDASAKPATTASANSPPSFSSALNDSTSSAPAITGADATAQAAMAALIAQGRSASPDTSSSDDAAAQGGSPSAAGPSDIAMGASAAAMATAAAASMSAAVTASISAATRAVTAAVAAQTMFAAASTTAADKRTHSNSTDSTLSGSSNDGSAGAAQLLTSNTSTDGGPVPTFKVAAGVDTAQFGQGVADRVSTMMDGNLTSAKLQVNPPSLGPIEVRIALQGGHAQVSFSSHSAVTRDALESGSEKLKEILGSQGFSSVSVDISQRSFQERSPQTQAYESMPSNSAVAPILAQAPLPITRIASALLDAYA